MAVGLRPESAAVRALATAFTPSRAAAGADIADWVRAPEWALYAGIAVWASLPQPVRRAHSEYYLAKTVDGKAAARVALRAARSVSNIKHNGRARRKRPPHRSRAHAPVGGHEGLKHGTGKGTGSRWTLAEPGSPMASTSSG